MKPSYYPRKPKTPRKQSALEKRNNKTTTANVNTAYAILKTASDLNSTSNNISAQNQPSLRIHNPNYQNLKCWTTSPPFGYHFFFFSIKLSALNKIIKKKMEIKGGAKGITEEVPACMRSCGRPDLMSTSRSTRPKDMRPRVRPAINPAKHTNPIIISTYNKNFVPQHGKSDAISICCFKHCV